MLQYHKLSWVVLYNVSDVAVHNFDAEAIEHTYSIPHLYLIILPSTYSLMMDLFLEFIPSFDDLNIFT